MKVIACQPNTVWEDKTANHERVQKLLDRHPPSQGALVVLPEMFATGFTLNVPRITEGETRESQRSLSETAVQHQVFVIGGIVTDESSGKGRNEAVVFDHGGKADRAVLQDAPVHVWREIGTLRGREGTTLFPVAGMRRRAVDLLRPAFSRGVSFCGELRGGTFRGDRQRATGASGALDHTAQSASNREPGLRGGSESLRR